MTKKAGVKIGIVSPDVDRQRLYDKIIYFSHPIYKYQGNKISDLHIAKETAHIRLVIHCNTCINLYWPAFNRYPAQREERTFQALPASAKTKPNCAHLNL